MIEILLVLAIIAILAGAILVSIGSQRQKARQAKMLAELSGTLQPIVMCLSDGGTITNMTTGSSGGTAICSEGNAYGKWPTLDSVSGYSSYTKGGDFSAGTWYFRTNSVGGYVVCCNAASSKCGIITQANCTSTYNIP